MAEPGKMPTANNPLREKTQAFLAKLRTNPLGVLPQPPGVGDKLQGPLSLLNRIRNGG